MSINVETEITDAAVGEEIFFNVPEVTAVGATIKSVKVFIIESEQENELSVSNGKYSFIVQGEQDLILRIKAIDNDGAVICWDYAVSVLEKEDDGFAEDLDWQQFLSQT